MRSKLKELRKEKKLTQREMAKLCGITRLYYTNIENGRGTPSFNVILKIKEVLGYDKDDLFLLENVA